VDTEKRDKEYHCRILDYFFGEIPQRQDVRKIQQKWEAVKKKGDLLSERYQLITES